MANISKQAWDFPVRVLDDFLLTLFEKYADLLKKRFSDDFQEVSHNTVAPTFLLTILEIVSTDDYMPMPIQSPEEFNKVLNVSWYHPEKPLEEQVYVYIQNPLFYLL